MKILSLIHDTEDKLKYVRVGYSDMNTSFILTLKSALALHKVRPLENVVSDGVSFTAKQGELPKLHESDLDKKTLCELSDANGSDKRGQHVRDKNKSKKVTKEKDNIQLDKEDI